MFHKCKNSEEAKKLYHRLAKHLHPDQGGDNEFMILLKESYDITLNQFKDPSPTINTTNTTQPINIVRAGDKRLEFLRTLSSLLQIIAVNPDVLYYLNTTYNFFNKNGYFTLQQYETLKRIYKGLEEIYLKRTRTVKRSKRL